MPLPTRRRLASGVLIVFVAFTLACGGAPGGQAAVPKAAPPATPPAAATAPALPPATAAPATTVPIPAAATVQVPVPASPSPIPAPPVAATVIPTQPSAPPRQRVTIASVTDGDTVRILINGVNEPLRIIGLDTPEVVDPRTVVQCFGREASERARQLLPPGTQVEFAPDPTQDTRDSFGRLLGYIWLPDGRLFPEVMIREGYGFEYTFRLPYQYQALFREAQAEARAAQRGLWAPDTCAGDPNRAAVTPTPVAPVPKAQPTPPTAPKPGGVLNLTVTGGRPGGNARASVTGAPPGSTCSIRYVTPAGTVSQAQGLITQTASAQGTAAWTWVIGSNTRPGVGTVTVTCGGVQAQAPITIG
jgi:micrococcal nuclease